MNCDFAREHLLAYVESKPPLPPEEHAGIRDHLADCSACRTEMEALREQVALLRGAGQWARDLGESLELHAPTAARTSPGRLRRAHVGKKRAKTSAGRFLWLLAAAAALLIAALGWKHLQPAQSSASRDGNQSAAGPFAPGHLISGVVIGNRQPVGAMVTGRRYTVSPGQNAEISLLANRARVTLQGGSQFSLPIDFHARPGLDLSCGKLHCSSDLPLHIRIRRLTALACGEFAVATSAAAPPPPPLKPVRISGILTDWLFPCAYASSTPGPAANSASVEGFLLKSGWAEVTLAGRSMRLTSRQAIIGGDGGPILRGFPQQLLAEMRAQRRALLAGLLSTTYSTVLADYTARHARYLLELEDPRIADERKRDLGWRIAMMSELREAHARRLSELLREEAPQLRRARSLEIRIGLLVKLLNERNNVTPPTAVEGGATGETGNALSSTGEEPPREHKKPNGGSSN